MSNFIELIQADVGESVSPVTINRYHISTVSKSFYTKRTIIRMHNGSAYEVEEPYEEVKDLLKGIYDVCK